MRVAVLALSLLSACQVKVDANTPPPSSVSTRQVPVGPTPSVTGNHETVELAEGKYEGDLLVGGNHNTVTGAGFGKTIIKGKLLMNGNHNTVSSVTIEGGGTVEGNHNDATKAELHGDVTTSGNKNR
jgi:hypothetical protein